MKTIIKHSAWTTLLILMTLALSFNAVLAQEEAEAAEATGSAGIMLGVLGLGILVILGLGAAMNARSKENNTKKE